MSLDYAAAVNEEINDLFEAGADVVQIDDDGLGDEPQSLTLRKRSFGGERAQLGTFRVPARRFSALRFSTAAGPRAGRMGRAWNDVEDTTSRLSSVSSVSPRAMTVREDSSPAGTPD